MPGVQLHLTGVEEVGEGEIGELGEEGGSQENEVGLLTQVVLEGQAASTQRSVHDRRFQSWAVFNVWHLHLV